jgi:hypothetical protein
MQTLRNILGASLCMLLGSGLLFGLTGCGGGQALKPTSSAVTLPKATAYGDLRLSVQWPARSRVIPAETDYLVAHVTGEGIYDTQDGESEGIWVELPRPAPPTTTTQQSVHVPIGYKLVTIYAMKNDNTVLAMGAGTTNVLPQHTSGLEVELNPPTAADNKLSDLVAYIETAAQTPPTSYDAALVYVNGVTTLATQAVALAEPGSPAAIKANAILVMMDLGKAGVELAKRWDVPFPTENGGGSAVAAPMTRGGGGSGLLPWVLPNPTAITDLLVPLAMPNGVGKALAPSTISAAARSLTNRAVLLSHPSAGTRSIDTGFPIEKIPQIQKDIEEVLMPALAAVRSRFDAIQLDHTVEVAVPEAELSFQLDPGDLLFMRAVTDLASGFMNQMVAYNLALPTTFTTAAPIVYDVNNDGKVTPAEYLPPAPFGTLTVDGATHMSNAIAAYREAAQLVEQGCTFHLQRPWQIYEASELFDAGPDFVYGYSYYNYETQSWEYKRYVEYGQVTDNMSMIRDASQELQKVLAGPYFVSRAFVGMDVTVDLSRPFTHPISDIRSILPTFTLLDPQITTLRPGAFPDPTFNGVLPDGLPDALLYPTGNSSVWVY